MCEKDPAAGAVLEKHFPDVPLEPDITKLKKLPSCDLVTAGWPCQDLSQAGRTAGNKGRNSSLVRHVFRLLDSSHRKPKYVLLENVAFALHLDGGRAIREVTKELEARDYRWAYRILDSIEFGLPQRRRRIFVLACRKGDPESILYDGDSSPRQICDSRFAGFYWTEGNRGVGWSVEAVPPLKGGSGLSIPSPPAIWDKEEGLFFSPGIVDAERLQGFPRDWTRPAAQIEGARVRWRLVGNAVSVPVARWIGQRIVAFESKRLRGEKRPQTCQLNRHNMAWGGPGKNMQCARLQTEGPRKPKRRILAKFKFADTKPLSCRAASGFLRRLQESPLIVDESFKTDLAEYSATSSWSVDRAA